MSPAKWKTWMTDKAPIMSKERSFVCLCRRNEATIKITSIQTVTMAARHFSRWHQATDITNIIGCWNLSYSDAELHIFSTINFHPFVEQADLLKVFSVNHKAANQGRTPEIERKRRKERCQKKIWFKCKAIGELKCKYSLKPTYKNPYSNPQLAHTGNRTPRSCVFIPRTLHSRSSGEMF